MYMERIVFAGVFKKLAIRYKSENNFHEILK